MDNGRYARCQRGASMIEVLVAIVVIALGLLGIASTQTLGLANTHSAMQRSYAAQFTNELADIARASARYAESPNSVFVGFEEDTVLAQITVDVNAGTQLQCFAVNSNCSPEQMAAESLHVWRQRLLQALPGSTFSVARNNTGVFIFTLSWNDARQDNWREENNGQPTPLSIVTRFTL